MMNMIMMNMNQGNYKNNFFEILVLRSQWEDIVLNNKSTYKLINNDSTISTLTWFVSNGSKSNRFRKKFKQATAIANKIVEYYETADISSIHRETIEAL
jgi:hypothetical protein